MLCEVSWMFQIWVPDWSLQFSIFFIVASMMHIYVDAYFESRVRSLIVWDRSYWRFDFFWWESCRCIIPSEGFRTLYNDSCSYCWPVVKDVARRIHVYFVLTWPVGLRSLQSGWRSSLVSLTPAGLSWKTLPGISTFTFVLTWPAIDCISLLVCHLFSTTILWVTGWDSFISLQSVRRSSLVSLAPFLLGSKNSRVELKGLNWKGWTECWYSPACCSWLRS